MEFELSSFAALVSALNKQGLLAPLVSLIVCVVSVFTSSCIAVYGARRTQTRELEREMRDSYLLFYDPLLSLLEPLSQYLNSPEALEVDLAEFDPSRSAHRKKLVNVSAYARGLEAIFQSGKSALSVQNPDLSKRLSQLRYWLLAVSYIDLEGEKLAGDVPSDREVQKAIEDIRHIVTAERGKLRWT